jgi:hypothetical protein
LRPQSLPIAQENGRFVTRTVSILNPAIAAFLPSTSPYDVYEPYNMGEVEEEEAELDFDDQMEEQSTDGEPYFILKMPF